MEFGSRGYIQPPVKHELSIEEFKQFFVDQFPSSQTRRNLFEGYLRYTRDFREVITPNFIQWIGGSFTTKKIHPRDIDMLTIIAHETYEAHEYVIENRFRRGTKDQYGVDAYIIASYTNDHPKYPLYNGNLVYWDNQFSKTRTNRAGRRFKRGYVQIIQQKIKL